MGWQRSCRAVIRERLSGPLRLALGEERTRYDPLALCSPCSAELALARHAEDRHAPTDGRLLRYTDGRSVTHRRYDGLWARIGRHLPWARTQQISTHWLRHTTSPAAPGRHAGPA
jgi:YD repeat-containing protein